MARVLAIDYGQKRVGLAVTDNLQIIATSIGTVHSKDIFKFLYDYVSKETVESFVVGLPMQMNNQVSESARFIEPFVKLLKKNFPNIPIHRVDERFTSKMASRVILESGVSKKTRQNKALVDTVSAVIILQSYLESKNY
ncbi:MAG: Holliday junction resolvase RuvX [Bacteroidota bacterium]